MERYTEDQQEILTWFKRKAPSLGELYQGALQIISDPTFPGRTRFVAHAAREICNRLPDAITGPKSSERFEWKNRLDDLEKDWQKAGFSLVTTGQSIPSSVDVVIPRRLKEKIANLLNDYIKTRETGNEVAIRLFEGITPENQNLRDTLRPVIDQWLRGTKWFVGHAHERDDPFQNTNSNELEKQFELFETTLGALVRGFYKTIEGLDEILEDANT